MRLCRAFHCFFATRLMNILIPEHMLDCIYYMPLKITLKFRLGCDNVNILPYIRDFVIGVIPYC